MGLEQHRFYPTHELHNPHARLRLYAQVLHGYRAHASCAVSLERLDLHLMGSHTIVEGPLAREFERALKATDTLTGLAWREIESFMSRAGEIAKSRGHPIKTAIDYRPMPQLAVAMLNLATCLEARKTEKSPDARIIHLLGALTQVEEVMENTVGTALSGVRSGAAIGGRDAHLANAIQAFLELKWVPGLEVSLVRVRNAWAHGLGLVREGGFDLLDQRSLKVDGAVVRDPAGWSVTIRLTADDLEKYIQSALAAQSALTFETAAALSYVQRAILR